jgi:hypothetical protein
MSFKLLSKQTWKVTSIQMFLKLLSGVTVIQKRKKKMGERVKKRYERCCVAVTATVPFLSLIPLSSPFFPSCFLKELRTRQKLSKWPRVKKKRKKIGRKNILVTPGGA